MTMRLVTLASAYVVMGVVATVLFYFLTGIPQFGVDVMEPDTLFPSPGLAHILDLVVAFLFSRVALAVLEAVALEWCLERSLRVPIILLVGVAVPVLFEVLVARPYAHSWVGMVWAILNTWPTVPEHIMPARLVFRTAAAYLAPAALTGIAVSTWAASMVRRGSQLADRGASHNQRA